MTVQIHFVLPGGGVKGSFQGGFLYELLNSYSDQFTISRIDGTSVGALNGYAFALGERDRLRDTWFQIEKLEDIFEPVINLPLLNTVSQGYNLVNQFGIYSNQNLANLVHEIGGTDSPTPTTPGWSFWDSFGFGREETNQPPHDNPEIVTASDSVYQDSEGVTISDTNTNLSNNTIRVGLDKFNCVVVSLREGQSKYINGINPLINQYVHASACPWIISPPHHLEGDVVTDGGLLESYPTAKIGKIDTDLTVLVGYDSSKTAKTGHEGANFLAYFNRLIDISRSYLPNVTNIKSLFDTLGDRGVIVNNPLEVSFLDFNQEHIQKGFEMGQEAAHDFAKKYLLSYETA